MLMIMTLSILIVIALFSILIGGSLSSSEAELININATNSGSSSNFDFYNLSQQFYIDGLVGMLIVIIVIISISALIGLRIFSSGLSENSVKMLTLGITYVSIWSMFSTLAYPLIAGIEVFGFFIYIILTIGFVLGIIQKFQEF